ncbi:hypothetical protein Tco_0993098 [Tanacetum coccineum]|uniref:DNA-directed RNA polymerase n=1 Tax=Tanacetum coccineum TaxID=301880 RepID=A0ABQ5F4V2_9ASTR
MKLRSRCLTHHKVLLSPWGKFGDLELHAVVRCLSNSIACTRGHLTLKFGRWLEKVTQSDRTRKETRSRVENKVFDLGVMEPLCFGLIDPKSFIGMITKPHLGFVLKLERKMACFPLHKLDKEYTRWVFSITYDCTGSTKSGEERFQKNCNCWASLVGSAFASTTILTLVDCHEWMSPEETESKVLFGCEVSTMMSPGGSLWQLRDSQELRCVTIA